MIDFLYLHLMIHKAAILYKSFESLQSGSVVCYKFPDMMISNYIQVD
jgi:hypothetical protein